VKTCQGQQEEVSLSNGEAHFVRCLHFFEANKGLLLTSYWAFAIGGVLGLAVVPAVSAAVLLRMKVGCVGQVPFPISA
jgi:hypothetical protein